MKIPPVIADYPARKLAFAKLNKCTQERLIFLWSEFERLNKPAKKAWSAFWRLACRKNIC